MIITNSTDMYRTLDTFIYDRILMRQMSAIAVVITYDKVRNFSNKISINDFSSSMYNAVYYESSCNVRGNSSNGQISRIRKLLVKYA